jgi:hypothetical protein
MRSRVSLSGFLLLLVIGGCVHPNSSAPAAASPTLASDAALPEHPRGWVQTELYFGLGPADQPDKGVSEAGWKDFLDQEVTPRFPAGLSVLDVYGQWEGKRSSSPERLRSKLLIIDFPDTPENRGRIEAIRSAWKQRTGDQSVMRVTELVDVSF